MMTRRSIGGAFFGLATTMTSGSDQSYKPGEGTRISQGLEPDIELIQELNYQSNRSSDLRTFANTAFGMGSRYFRMGGGE